MTAAPHARVPRTLIARAARPGGGSDLAVYGALDLLCPRSSGTPRCVASVQDVAEVCGLLVDTVRQSIARMASMGLVEVRERYAETGARLANEYVLHGVPRRGGPGGSRRGPTLGEAPGAEAEGLLLSSESVTTVELPTVVQHGESLQATLSLLDAPLPEPVPEMTPGQRAHVLFRAYYDEHVRTYGRAPAVYSAPQFIGLFKPFFAQGVSHEQLWAVVSAFEREGRTLTRAAIDSALKGTRRPRRDAIDGALSELRFDADGNRIAQ